MHRRGWSRLAPLNRSSLIDLSREHRDSEDLLRSSHATQLVCAKAFQWLGSGSSEIGGSDCDINRLPRTLGPVLLAPLRKWYEHGRGFFTRVGLVEGGELFGGIAHHALVHDGIPPVDGFGFMAGDL
jgi:hypothetical protein